MATEVIARSNTQIINNIWIGICLLFLAQPAKNNIPPNNPMAIIKIIGGNGKYLQKNPRQIL